MSISFSVLQTLSRYPLAAFSALSSRPQPLITLTGSAAATATARSALSPLRGLRYLVDGEINNLTTTRRRADDTSDSLRQITEQLVAASELIDANRDINLSDSKRKANQESLNTILDTINDLAAATDSGGTALLDGSLTLETGLGSIDIGSMDTQSLGAVDVNGTSYSLADLGSDRSLNIADGDLDAAADAIAAALATTTGTDAQVYTFVNDNITTGLSVARTALLALSGADAGIQTANDASAIAALARQDILQSISATPLLISQDLAGTVLKLIA